MNKAIFIIIIFITLFTMLYCQPEDKSHPLTDGQKGEDGVYIGYTFADTVTEHSGAELDGYPAENALNGVFGEGNYAGSLDVFVVGESDYAVFSWDGKKLVNGEGDDFKVFENGFYTGGSDDRMSMDLGMVEVSRDGLEWHSIPVNYTDQPYENSPDGKVNFIGIDTVHLNFDDDVLIEPSSDEAGGDGFDLSDAGIDEGDFIRYIKLIDGGDTYPDGQIESNGIDIDGVCAFYWMDESNKTYKGGIDERIN